VEKNIGELLEKLRGKSSLREIASKTGLSHSYIRDLELGKNRSTNSISKPSPLTLKKLSEVYNYPYEDLMQKSGYIDKKNPQDDLLEQIFIKYLGDDVKLFEKLISESEIEGIKDFAMEPRHFFNLLSSEQALYFSNALLKKIQGDATPYSYKDFLQDKKNDDVATDELIRENKANYKPFSNRTEFVQIPIYGEIRAGYDSLATENIIGYETVSKDTVKDGIYFYLIVKGDSMIDEGIREGMRVLVKSQNNCEHGKIGIVLVNGDEGTLKRVFYDKNNVILQASNKDIPPRVLPLHEVRIQGQVKKVEFDV
jgi:SOS-response transcriptional repressor LexA